MTQPDSGNRAPVIGETWIDPDTGLGWSITSIDFDGGITAEAVVERTFCDADELTDLLRPEVPDHG